jgi:hypothetical protein
VAGGTGTLERASEVLHDLSKQIEGPNNKTSTRSFTENGASDKPIPVEIKQPDPGALQTLAALASDPSAHNDWNRCHLRYIHFAATPGPAEPAC